MMNCSKNPFSARLAHALSIAAICLAFSSCSGGGGTTTPPIVIATPTSTPSSSATPTATPTVMPANFYPFSNGVAYEGGSQSINFQSNIGGTEAVLTTASTCSASVVGNIGDYTAGDTWPAIVANVVQNYDIKSTDGQFPVYVFTKDATGNIYIVGYYYGTGVTTCVSPYLLVKSQLRVGDSWTYTDINGMASTATVMSFGNTESFTVTGNGSHGGEFFTYQNVAEVSYYNGQFNVYYAAGVGPVQLVNFVNNTNGSSPNTYTAYQTMSAANSP